MLSSRFHLPVLRKIQDIKGCFNSLADLLKIAVVIRAPYFCSSCCFWAEVQLFLCCKTCEICRYFLWLAELTHLFHKASRLPGVFLLLSSTIDVNLSDIANLSFQIWSTLAGDEELAGGIKPITNGKIFSFRMNNYQC